MKHRTEVERLRRRVAVAVIAAIALNIAIGVWAIAGGWGIGAANFAAALVGAMSLWVLLHRERFFGDDD